MSTRTGPLPDPPAGERYEIVLGRRLGARSSQAFRGFGVVDVPHGGCVLRGTLSDQAALHGILGRIRDLGIPLVSVRRLDPAVEATGALDDPGPDGRGPRYGVRSDEAQ